MSRLSDLVAEAIEEVRDGEGRTPAALAANLVIARADDDDLDVLAHEAATLRCKRASERTMRALRELLATPAEAMLFPEMRAGYAIDEEGTVVKATNALREIEFRKIIEIRRKQVEDDRAHLNVLLEAYEAARPIWASHPDYTFGECCTALRLAA